MPPLMMMLFPVKPRMLRPSAWRLGARGSWYSLLLTSATWCQVNVSQQDNTTSQLCLYWDNPGQNETVAGSVKLRMNPGKKVEHVGIRVELIGQIGACLDSPSACRHSSWSEERGA